MKIKHVMTAIALASSLALGSVANAQDITPAQKTQIESIVHSYLVKNPEVIAEAAQTLQQKQMDQMKAKGQEAAGKNADQLFGKNGDPVAGNKDGKVTVVEFFDYQCPHCVDMDSDINGLLKNNPDVRFVFKEFPIRGATSLTAAKAALAAQLQGKYMPFHEELMCNAKDLSDDKIMAIAKKLGLNMTQFKADMNGAVVDDQIKANYKLAQELQLYGTPAFFVAKTAVAKDPSKGSINFIPGQVNQKFLQDAVNNA